MKKKLFLYLAPLSSLFFIASNCTPERLFLSDYLKRTFDVITSSCDPYNTGVKHSCALFASENDVLIYDATDKELVLAPTGYFPLMVNTGFAKNLSPIIGSEDFVLAFDDLLKNVYLIPTTSILSKNLLSFQSTKAISIDILPKDHPFKIASIKKDNTIIMLASYPDEAMLRLFALDIKTSSITGHKEIPLGTKPKHIKIDEKGMFALITDEAEHEIHLLDLNNIQDFTKNFAAQKIDIGFNSQKIYLAYQIINSKETLLALVLGADDKKVALVDIMQKKMLSTYVTKDFLSAGYLPTGSYQPLSKDSINNWFLLADIKGFLTYFEIKHDGTLRLIESIDAKRKKYLAAKSLIIEEIAAVLVLNQPAEDKMCTRQLFFSVSYAADRNGTPIEANGHICEKEIGVYRLGPEHPNVE